MSLLFTCHSPSSCLVSNKEIPSRSARARERRRAEMGAKLVRVLAFSFFLLSSLPPGTFGKGSEARTDHGMPIHPAFHLHISNPNTEAKYRQDDGNVPVFNPTNPVTTTPTYNPPPTVTPTNPYAPPAFSDTTPTNPATNPYTTPTMGNPTSPTPTMGNPTSSGQSWCVASPGASETALQVGLDYACGYGGADCSAIQQGGSCFNPDTVRDHASYAFNSYYQKNPLPTSCDFGGTAMITNTDPSTSACQYPSSSSSGSTSSPTPITSNPPLGGGGGGGSPVFGTSPPDYSDNSISARMLTSFAPVCFLLSIAFLMVHN